nr:Receptor-like kinase [Ipomoea batatas]GMD04936.1 Receptor-like kinase [Ipomoea batatas]GMD06996.1 Receptor-like kinase [Ipomoea batatas]GMD08910.1 Receptor-like kinase [Ipomoea batatas]GMD10119.1 Receptor-like kinase [Ipomoea batatas]
MKEIFLEGKSLRFLLLLCSISSQFISGFSGNPSGPKDEKKTDDHASSSKSTGSRTLLICIGLIAFAGLSFFLFKIWQRKRREEQYARLLKLFEEDDELEVELGLRD